MIPLRRGFPIRTSMDQSLLAAPHGFSQRATSFIASWCQGIHRMPFCRSIFHISPQIEMIEQTRTAYPPCTGTIHQKFLVIHRSAFQNDARNSHLQKSNTRNKTSKKHYPVPASHFMQPLRSSQSHAPHHHASEHSKHFTIISSQLTPSLGQTTHRKASGPIFRPITCMTKHQPVHVSRRTKTYSP